MITGTRPTRLRRAALSVFLGLGLGLSAGAQEFRLVGRVLEEANREPVPGAAVTLPGFGLATRTDSTGRFLLQGGSTALGRGAGGAWSAARSRGAACFDLVGRLLGREAGPWRRGASRARAKRAAYRVEIAKDRLRTAAVEASLPTADLGEIVLRYPPRVLDVGAPPIHGSLVLFSGDGDSLRSRAELEANWISWKGPHPVRWQIMPDPADPGNRNRRTLKTCCSLNIGEDDLLSKATFRDFQLHVEFNLPGHANSGVYLQNRYELQIYPPHAATGPLANHDIGALVGEHAPDTNVYRGFGRWQAFDVTFRSSRWRGTTRLEAARVSVWWNGVRIHDNVAANAPATGGSSGVPVDSSLHGLKLQVEGGSDVRYRNIWIKRLDIRDPVTGFGY